MKIFTCLLFLFYIGSVSAQYQPVFSDTFLTWRKYDGKNYYITINPAPDYEALIDSEKWIKTYVFAEYFGADRTLFFQEDTTNGVIWCYSQDTSTKSLIMDLNLTVGDSFYFSLDSTISYSVDSVYYDTAGLKTIRFNGVVMLDTIAEPIIFKERLGPNIGLDYLYPFTEQSTPFVKVVCHYVAKGILPELLYLYPNQKYSNYCLHTSVSENKNIKDKLYHYPNPANETINIESSENIQSIEIYNLAGQLLIHQQLNTKYSTIDIEQLTKAVYIVKVKLGEHDTQVHKFIKQ
jgi:hypothetical protein